MASEASEKPDISGISKIIAKSRPNIATYEYLYRKLHANPELSLQEEATAGVVASYLRSLKHIDVRTNIGGHGVVGIIKNGTGKTVLLRADMDALPIKEQTGLEFASTKRMVDVADGVERPVMHACGHDMHTTSLLAAGELLNSCRESWSGTVVLLFQPNEERGAGAQAMVDDGLYDEGKHAVPKPDVVLGSHVMPMRAGLVNTRKGVFNSTAVSYRVTLFGRGGHGSRPHTTVDPVVLAASTVMKLQTIVSRETNPQEAVVVTVGASQAGAVENVISGEAKLLVNTRAFSAEGRDRVRVAMERIINAECQAAGSPRPPLIEEISSFPLLYNDETTTEFISQAMKDHFGNNFSPNAPISMGSEDFGNLAISTPSCFWNYGGIDPQKWDDVEKRGKLAEEIPGTGASLARKFASVYPIVLLARNPENYTPIVDEINHSGGKALGISTNVTDAKSVNAAFEQIQAKLPGMGLATAVYNVGGEFKKTPFLELSEEAFTTGYETNAKGAFLFSRNALPHLLSSVPKSEHPPTLIFTGATASVKGSPKCASYATGKFALRALSQSLAREFGPEGVHVSHVIVDGVIESPETRDWDIGNGKPDALLSSKAIAEEYWHLYTQHRSCFTYEIDLRPWVEKW
ncbi:MAG: hypothetical protein Q9213_007912 [Squamulea squamosa]